MLHSAKTYKYDMNQKLSIMNATKNKNLWRKEKKITDSNLIKNFPVASIYFTYD